MTGDCPRCKVPMAIQEQVDGTVSSLCRRCGYTAKESAGVTFYGTVVLTALTEQK